MEPLTAVPFVDPKSSMNKSFPINENLACRPLTKPAPITMSHPALRPTITGPFT